MARLLVTCEYAPCSTPFYRETWQVSAKVFCSPECYRADRALRYVQQGFAGRFWAKVAICEHGTTCEDCCWLWTGALHGQGGYGNFRATPHKPGNVSAHIASWFLATGAWPKDGLFVLYSCDRPACVNPAHLFLGTHTDNMQDCVNKGRQGYVTHPERVLRGEAHPARLHPERMARGDRNGMRLHPESVLRGDNSPVHKLTEAQLAEAIAMHKTGQWTFKQLGERFGVTGAAISQRIHRSTNNHK